MGTPGYRRSRKQPGSGHAAGTGQLGRATDSDRGRRGGPPSAGAGYAHIFGPGDVVGIDPRQIIRTEPRPFTSNFEPNYLCGIEFDAPDLPWLFTPAAGFE